eukprot:Nk52_evm2s171 gene=Nk52_evmTU2s171
MLLFSIGIISFILSAFLLPRGAWLPSLSVFMTGFFLFGVPSFTINLANCMNRYISSSFAPANPYESFVIVGIVGGILLLYDSKVIQRVCICLFAAYLTSVLVFSFANFSQSSLSGESGFTSGYKTKGSTSLPSTSFGNLGLPTSAKYILLGGFCVIYLALMLFRRTRLIALSSFTSISGGYLLVLGAEFLGLLSSEIFIRLDGLIRIYAKPQAGSLCVFKKEGIIDDQCFQKHLVWLLAWVLGTVFQLLIGLLISTPPAECLPAKDNPFKPLKSPFRYKDGSKILFYGTKRGSDATDGKHSEHQGNGGDPLQHLHTSFADTLRANGVVTTTTASQPRLSEDSPSNTSSRRGSMSSSLPGCINGQSEVDVEQGLPSKLSNTDTGRQSNSTASSRSHSSGSSSCDVYMDLSSIPDPWLATCMMVAQYIALGFVALCIVLTVDWIYSSTLIAVVLVFCYVVVFNIVLSAFFLYMSHYIRHFWKVFRHTIPDTGADNVPAVFPLQANMKTLGCYCLLSNQKQASTDCFRSMYGTFCRNMDPKGNFETTVVSVSKDVDIVRHELLMRDVFRVKLCKDMYGSLQQLLMSMSDDIHDAEKLLPSWNALCQYSAELILSNQLKEEKETDLKNNYEIMNWINSKEEPFIAFSRITQIWILFTDKHKAEWGDNWRDSFALEAWNFIKMQCERFMYFHRTSRVLRKPGQYQDLMQLSTWGIDYSYTYPKQHAREGSVIGQSTFGFTGNLANNGLYSRAQFQELQQLFEVNTQRDFQRVKDAGLQGSDFLQGSSSSLPSDSRSVISTQRKSRASTSDLPVSSSDPNSQEQFSFNSRGDEQDASGPYSFTLLMDGDTGAPEGSVQRLAQIAFGNPLHGIIQPIIRPGTSYRTKLNNDEEQQLNDVCAMFHEVNNADAQQAASMVSMEYDSLASRDEAKEEQENTEEDEARSEEDTRTSTEQELIHISKHLRADIVVPKQSVFMWRLRAQEVSVPSTGTSASSVMGRSFFYGKGLINNLAYCSALLGSPEQPRDALPVDVYSHDTYEALFLRPYCTDEVFFTEDPVFNPLAIRYQKKRWMVGELINGCYLFPESFGRFVRILKTMHTSWVIFCRSFSVKERTRKAPLKLIGSTNTDQDICGKGTPVAIKAVKEPMLILTAPFFILVALTCQTIFTSTERLTVDITDIYNEQQLYDAVIHAHSETKYWFFIYLKNLDILVSLLIFVMVVYLGINIVFKIMDILFHLRYRVHSTESTLTVCRRKFVHISICVLELMMSIISYPPEIVLGTMNVIQGLHSLVTGRLKWKPQREVEIEMNTVAHKGVWVLLRINLKRGGALVMLSGAFVIVWLLVLNSVVVRGEAVVTVPVFVVWIGALCCVIYPFWMALLGMALSNKSFLVRWLVEIELVLNHRDENSHKNGLGGRQVRGAE